MSVIENAKILVIDDTPSIRTFLRISMMDYGATFHEASTAGEGHKLCETEEPDLVILDLGLPDKDGLDLLPDIVGANGSAPKVVVLSVRNDRRTREIAYERGASGYVTKPFIMEDLIETIEHVLR
ncbi:response regulator [Kordiimonas gwangyangensis]|uniref:response regulator n=1 Tax=Kordiimonas gwangyangensis TaxID=288022 RepID=UPI00036A37D7|nr:response regulator [Kordiimonas gwangyangensis]